MLQDFISRFKVFAKEQNLNIFSSKTILTVSGGMDSVVMAYLFHKSGFKFAIAHCNFSLRGEESEADAEFVQDLAKRYKVPFFTVKFDTKKYSEQNKVSIQMAARELRYQWFELLRTQEGYDLIATAHHQNDVLETVLLNLTRGTGIAGLHGIRAQHGAIIRPLIFANRDEIQDVMAEAQLGWREDSSNQTTKYARNLIRHEVIPQLIKINGALVQSFTSTVEKLTSTELLLEESVLKFEALLDKKSNGEIWLAKTLILQHQAIVVFGTLEKYGFNWEQTKKILDLVSSAQPGTFLESHFYKLTFDRESVIISPKFKTLSKPFFIEEGVGQWEYMNQQFTLEKRVVDDSFAIPTSDKIACIDARKLKFPLVLRVWREGDAIVPLGMDGQKKKVSDLLIDKKVPRPQKESTLVLLTADKIAWVVGHRLDDRFKVVGSTKEVFVINVV